MLVEVLKSKIHRAVVTETALHYEGSITIDPLLFEASGILENEKVHVLDINNGSRFETYAIKGKKGSGDMCINGAAARLAEKGDVIIVLSYAFLDEKEAVGFKPKVIKVDGENMLVEGGV